jgi:serine phosphatase RsbU (regulator of sigma subunit)
LACTEVWGGNLKVGRAVELPGLTGYVYSTPYEPASGGGGDVYYLSSCEEGLLARIALADVSGHGRSASPVADRLRQLMREHINTWNQSAFMQELNREFAGKDGHLKYATVILLGFYLKTRRLLYTNAGHPPPLWYRAQEKKWEFLREEHDGGSVDFNGLPLGVIPGTHYYQTIVDLKPDDILVLYTDAVTETVDRAGKELGQEGLLKLAGSLPTDSAVETAEALLADIHSFRGGADARDDETIIALQRRRPRHGRLPSFAFEL